jgi:hypothetical protein
MWLKVQPPHWVLFSLLPLKAPTNIFFFSSYIDFLQAKLMVHDSLRVSILSKIICSFIFIANQ